MKASVENRPSLDPKEVRFFVRERFGLDGEYRLLPAEWDQNFRLDAGDEGAFVVKVARYGEEPGVLAFQDAVLRHVEAVAPNLPVPRVVRPAEQGDPLLLRDSAGRGHYLRILTWLDGDPLSSISPRDSELYPRIGRTLGELDVALEDFEHESMDRELNWDLGKAEWISSETARISDPGRRAIVERVLLQYRGRIRPHLKDLPRSVIQNDANDENILITEGVVSGLLDFGDMLRSETINELAITCAYTMLGEKDPLAAAVGVAVGYHGVRSLSDLELTVLFPLICMRLCVSVTNSAIVKEDDPENAHRLITDEPGWAMLERLQRVDWRQAEDRFRLACRLPENSRTGETPDLLRRRKDKTSPAQSLAYDQPLEMVRGEGCYLFEASDRAYLDCVNNVPHVGHSHRRVVAAQSKQAAILNTNTRYLHPLLVEYAERLTSTLPDPLDVCFFVNSGSEANELAVRIARTVTGRRDAIVLDGAYHGNTQTLIDLSPYKCEGTGGKGPPAWVRKVSRVDPYRGEGMFLDPGAFGGEPAFFIAEPILGCGGQVVLPKGYLQTAFEHVRKAGGLCLIDEVQVGFGRVGSHMWAFETQEVVPDIVTMGKPMGNGHPMGAVVTTRGIADRFANGMEYFSTFGGNPVSCAVGLAVLEVIETEKLQVRAARVGEYLADGFRKLAQRHPLIGDVRHLGMFMGVELVRDRNTKEPATEETGRLIERVVADGVLLSSEGPFHNVLKIKPPLAFVETDADLLLGAVDRGLSTG